ncbi:MAG: N-acetylmuramoyl-L-alanine amidase [Limisphaerales bacterium]
MFKIAGIIFCAALLLAGCATTSPKYSSDEPLPYNWSATNAVSKPASPVVQTNFLPLTISNGVAIVVSNTPPPIITNPPPVIAPKPTPAPIVTWTSLNRWATEHVIGKPHRISDSPVTAYAIGSTNGVMVLTLGSLDATWNGLEMRLAFEPQLIDGEILLHGLDLQKNLEPLLSGPPLTFSTNRIIVIDPGHGGSSLGAKSVLGNHYEKEFTLDWARRLAPLLATNGWKVFLTRTGDVDISLSNRVAFAEAQHADVFISLHFNSAAPDQKQAGLETYCLTPTGMPSSLTRGYDDTWAQNYPGNAFDAQNLQLAVRLHSALFRASGEEDRAVRRARFIGVLRGQKRPAILIEGGYLSNPAEARRVETPEFRQKLAEAVANALK